MDVYDYDDDIEDDTLLYNELNRLAEEYQAYLEKKGHKEAYIENQLDLIKFFGTHYLIGYVGQSILEIDGYDIYEFLGSWCVRKVIYHNKASIIPYLRVFKKFYNFLFQAKKISKDQHGDLIEDCSNPRKYIEKLERYEDLDPDSETREEDFENWLFDYDHDLKDDKKEELTRFTDFELRFLQNLPARTFRGVSLVEDFKKFGNYISERKSGIELTINLFCLKRKDIMILNSMMKNPEKLKKSVSQKDTVLIHFFFLVGKRLGLFKYTKKMKFMVTPLFTQFLGLSIKKQYYILFRAFWNKISWFRLNSYSMAGRPEWTHRDRHLYPPFFSSLKVDECMSYSEFQTLFSEFYNIDLFNPFSIGWKLIIGIFLEKILPLFDYFGLIKLNFKNTREIYNAKELKIKITPLGNLFFSGLSKLNYSPL